jgi:hypothetical protein
MRKMMRETSMENERLRAKLAQSYQDQERLGDDLVTARAEAAYRDHAALLARRVFDGASDEELLSLARCYQAWADPGSAAVRNGRGR